MTSGMKKAKFIKLGNFKDEFKDILFKNHEAMFTLF